DSHVDKSLDVPKIPPTLRSLRGRSHVPASTPVHTPSPTRCSNVHTEQLPKVSADGSHSPPPHAPASSASHPCTVYASPVPVRRAAASSHWQRRSSHSNVQPRARSPHHDPPTQTSLSDTFLCFHSIAGQT